MLSKMPVPLLYACMAATAGAYLLICLVFGLLVSAAPGLPAWLTTGAIALPPIAAVAALLHGR